MPGNRGLEQLAKVLVEAGATYRSSARMAVIIERGGSYDSARDALELAPTQTRATFEAQLLTTAIARERELVEATR